MRSLRRDEEEQVAVRAAALQVMLALTDLLSEAKMGTVGELTALAKLALVQGTLLRARAAGKGEPLASEIAVETGISRNDVPRLMRAQSARPSLLGHGRAKAEAVLAGWWSDPKFRDERGHPAALDRAGMVELVKRHGIGTKRASPIVKELLRAGAVKRQKDGRLKPVKQTCVNVQWDPQSLMNLGVEARRHLAALIWNLTRTDRKPVFIRTVESRPLPLVPSRVLRQEIEDSATVLIDGTRENLTRQKTASKSEASESRRLVLSIQILEEDPTQDTVRGAYVAPRKTPRRVRTTARGRRSPSGVGAT